MYKMRLGNIVIILSYSKSMNVPRNIDYCYIANIITCVLWYNDFSYDRVEHVNISYIYNFKYIFFITKYMNKLTSIYKSTIK